MAKLYPPVIAGTIPAFCGTSLEVPFSMNRAVGSADFTGFSLKIKKVSGALIGTVTDMNGSKWVERHAVTFKLTDEIYSQLKIGEFYKVQLAYINNNGQVGIYSTIGVTKFITKPNISIENLQPIIINNHIYAYQGIYNQRFSSMDESGNTTYTYGDTTEKLYSSRFILYDTEYNIIKDSGEILHNTTNDTLSYEATEAFMIPEDLVIDKIYYIYFTVTTVNGYTGISPRYRITQRRQIPMTLEAKISAELDYESGTIQIKLKGDHPNQVATGQFLLTRRADLDSNKWEELYYFSLASEIPDRLLFTDYTVSQGVTYTYSLQQFNENKVYSDRIYSNTLVADFEDLFLYDGSRQLKVRFNPKVSTFKTNVSESKTNTIGSKHPFITRNGNVNYKEFAISGLISYQMDENEKFKSRESLGIEQNLTDLITENIKAERDFKLDVLDWLNDGKPKLFRSPTEGNYIVRLMNISLTPNDTVGRMLHTFNCSAYEIDDYTYDNLNKYDLLSIYNDIQYQMRWATVELSSINDKGQVQYFTGQVNVGNNYGVNASRPVYHLMVSEMLPGTYFLLGESEETATKIYIGSTGAYEVKVNNPYTYVGIPKKIQISGDEEIDVQWTGTITYGYKAQVTSLFDLITNIEIQDIPDRQVLSGPVLSSDNMRNTLDGIEDIKTTLLNINYIKFTTREYYPLYVRRNEFEVAKGAENLFYTDSNNEAYHDATSMNSRLYYDVDQPINLNNLNSWNIYKIYFARENYEYKEVNGEGYYVDRVNHEEFSPFTGYYYDPSAKALFPDKNVFFVNVNGEMADLSETTHLTISGFDSYDIVKMGIGIMADVGYQVQISTYSFETMSQDVRVAKENYIKLRDNFLNNRGKTLIPNGQREVQNAYAGLISILTKRIEEYKEENDIG